MTIKRLIGSAPSQVSRNKDLGTMAFQDANNYIGLNAPTSFRNKIINGNFDIWQRATSFTLTSTAAYVSADRFSSSSGVNGVATFSRQTVDPSVDSAIAGVSKYYYRHNQTTANVSNGRLVQRVEGVHTLAGKTVTVSWYAKANKYIANAPGVYDIIVSQNFGSGGSPTAATSFTVKCPDLNTDWKRYSVTFTLPTIAGVTLGTNGDDHVEFQWRMPPNDTYIVDFAQVQVEEGTHATQFEVRPVAIELQMCKRYYQQITALIGTGLAADTIFCNPEFPVEMRVAPSIGLSQTTAGVNDKINFTSAGVGNFIASSGSVTVVGEVTSRNAFVKFTGYTGVTTQGVYLVNAVTGKLTLNAELL